MPVVRTPRELSARTIAEDRPPSIRAYAIVTLCYWAFTISDGALRMLVLGHFHQLGFDSLSLAFLFVLYEFFGIVTNLASAAVASKRGLHITLLAGLILQILALCLLALHDASWQRYVEVIWVMAAQALSGIAKDFTKMSSKTAVKFVARPGQLFGVVAVLTGSKNSLKGLGFFVGAVLLDIYGFDMALYIMAAILVFVLLAAAIFGDPNLGKIGAVAAGGAVAGGVAAAARASGITAGESAGVAVAAGGAVAGVSWWRRLLSSSSAVNRLSFARFFLFGARDVFFVVALPVFLAQRLGWSFGAVGTFMAIWVIVYGFVQAAAPKVLRIESHLSAALIPLVLAAVVSATAILVYIDYFAEAAVLIGVSIFGVFFALASSAHSYLILAYSRTLGEAAKDVGFYYAANASGRLVGTLLSGVSYLVGGFGAAMLTSALLLVISAVIARDLDDVGAEVQSEVRV